VCVGGGGKGGETVNCGCRVGSLSGLSSVVFACSDACPAPVMPQYAPLC
jgi:hypothetical protein